ncbi:hypothetical protein RAE03_10715 [Corynebacterium tuberculostearicum]|uniref:Uncharacterized protein n=1 Tax=Corynebacterium tuberculostearicum TaxID=38304 RepID=A0AAE4NMB9_9CORY|nr:hypothetical protein [Corynebacterium tuberculostearicum]MDV2420235.1 hypothetical protein [Corynebacterium tuberculostearicum]
MTPEIAKNLNEWAASQDLDLDAEFQEDPVTISTETQKALADKHIVMFNRAVSGSMTSFRSVSRHPSAPQGPDVPQHRSAVPTQSPQQGK